MKPRHAAALALVFFVIGWVALPVVDYPGTWASHSLIGLIAAIVFPLAFLARLIIKLGNGKSDHPN
jgi:hypothetical protein